MALPRNLIYPTTVYGQCTHHRMTRQSWGLEAMTTQILRQGGRGGYRGVSMKYYYILQCTGIWDENTFQSGEFSEIEWFVYN